MFYLNCSNTASDVNLVIDRLQYLKRKEINFIFFFFFGYLIGSFRASYEKFLFLLPKPVSYYIVDPKLHQFFFFFDNNIPFYINNRVSSKDE